MGKVLDYLEIAGLASGAELYDKLGADAAEELWQLVNDEIVSVHTEPLGAKFYRFPAYQREKGNPDSQKRILKFIKENPDANGQEIMNGTNLSIMTFHKQIKELLEEERIIRKKSGVAWLYREAI